MAHRKKLNIMALIEKGLENYTKMEVKKLKGLCFKFYIMGVTGLPDRIILLPGAKVIFFEMKSPGKDLRPKQLYWKKILERLGFPYYKINSKEQIKTILNRHVISS